MDQDETWHGGRPRPRRHCVRWGPSSPFPKGAQPPKFRSTSIVAKRSPISATAELLLNVLTVYAPHSGKPEEEKENFWNELFQLVSCILQNEIDVLAGDMNGHVGSNNVGYDGTHGGYGFGARNADGSRF